MPFTPPASPTTPYETVFEQLIEIIAKAANCEWRTIDRINEFSDPVYLKNSDAILVHVNDAFTRFFSPDISPVGRNASSFLESSIATASQHSDKMIAGTTTSLEFEHIGRGPGGQAYRIHTRKESLARFGNPGLALLGVSRIEEVMPESEAVPKLSIAEKHRRFRAMDETDRKIAQQIGHGNKVREIAGSLSLTTRAVEQRKRKILSTLDLNQTLDLVKLLVRMQDRGFIDLGL